MSYTILTIVCYGTVSLFLGGKTCGIPFLQVGFITRSRKLRFFGPHAAVLSTPLVTGIELELQKHKTIKTTSFCHAVEEFGTRPTGMANIAVVYYCNMDNTMGRDEGWSNFSVVRPYEFGGSF